MNVPHRPDKEAFQLTFKGRDAELISDRIEPFLSYIDTIIQTACEKGRIEKEN